MELMKDMLDEIERQRLSKMADEMPDDEDLERLVERFTNLNSFLSDIHFQIKCNLSKKLMNIFKLNIFNVRSKVM